MENHAYLLFCFAFLSKMLKLVSRLGSRMLPSRKRKLRKRGSPNFFPHLHPHILFSFKWFLLTFYVLGFEILKNIAVKDNFSF